ncbi:MAG: hypothetical protein JWM76_1499 [Pseudonocardiales bacterium]|nr:hypothetical protein [Pseudonocardiales bacterium]
MGAPVPIADAESAGFWQAAQRGELVIARCEDCRRWQHPPLERCRHCAGKTEFEPVSGDGTIFSFIVVRQATVPGHQVPYVVAIVELAEQSDIRVTGVVRAQIDEVRIGLPVHAQWTPVTPTNGTALEFESIP